MRIDRPIKYDTRKRSGFVIWGTMKRFTGKAELNKRETRMLERAEWLQEYNGRRWINKRWLND